MALTPYLTLLLLLSFSSSELIVPKANLRDKNSLVNCITDAIVLESILLKSAAELASGFYIPKAIEDLKHFWSLIPQWTATCKQIFSKPTDLPEAFPEYSESIYSSLKFDLKIKNSSIHVPLECIEAFLYSANHVYMIGEALNKNDSEQAGELLSSLSTIALQVITHCRKA